MAGFFDVVLLRRFARGRGLHCPPPLSILSPPASESAAPESFPRMFVQILLYLATLLGAVGLILAMPGPRRSPMMGVLGAILGAGALGLAWIGINGLLRDWNDRPAALDFGLDPAAFAFYFVFSAIAIGSAARVITHTRAVYAALWFVMVVLASAGLFLTLAAQFMAFAMVIIYGGAILVTYMFVIMLATQPTASDRPEDQPEFERHAREPVVATAVGFLLLAVLLGVFFDTAAWPGAAERNVRLHGVYGTAGPSDEDLVKGDALLVDGEVVRVNPILTRRPRVDPPHLDPDDPPLPAINTAFTGGESSVEALNAIPGDARVSNVERVGLDLFMSHPLGLELAGVILLVSLIGAVVIAKTHVEEEDAGDDNRATPGEGGATAYPTHEPAPDDPQSIGNIEGRLGV